MFMTRRPRVLLLIPHLGGGGAEQVAINLARHLSPEKYDLHLGLVAQGRTNDEPFPIGLVVHCLGASRVRHSAIRILCLVWKLKPALLLSGMAHLNLLLLMLRPLFPSKIRILVRQNSTVSSALATGDLPAWTSFLYRVLYDRADRVICQSSAMANDICTEIHLSPNKVAVLANPVDVDAIRATAESARNQWEGPGPHLFAVGRLSHEKGFDLLLQAFASIHEGFPTAKLAIAGVGPEEVQLKAQKNALGLDRSVRFLGRVPSPAAYFPGASLFVLSSRHEGMPNAILEAAAGGLPIVSLPASGGLVDLLRGQRGAWLASEISATALSASLLEALSALSHRERFSHSWIEKFRLDRAMVEYEKLIDESIGERRS
jgi:glycosyltransferase involved in cell wall biosynthesis